MPVFQERVRGEGFFGCLLGALGKVRSTAAGPGQAGPGRDCRDSAGAGVPGSAAAVAAGAGGAGAAHGAGKAGSAPSSCVRACSITCFAFSSLRAVFVAIVRGHGSDREWLLFFGRGLNKSKGRTVLRSPRQNPSLSSVFASHLVKIDTQKEMCSGWHIVTRPGELHWRDWSFWDTTVREGIQQEDAETEKI